MELEEMTVPEFRPRKGVRTHTSGTNADLVDSSHVDCTKYGDHGDSCTRLLEVPSLRHTYSSQSLHDVLGQDVADDNFLAEVAQKTNSYMIGRQEAETEVVIDRLVEREGSRDLALLYVLSHQPSEVKVQLMVSTLLHRGANPSFLDSEWQTPLHHATRRGYKGVVSKLLDHNAVPHFRDKRHQMPLHVAIENCMDDIASILLAFMLNSVVRPLFVTCGDKMAELSLHELIRNNMQQTVLAVLDCMIDPIGQGGHVKVYYHVMDADEKGRPPNHSQFEPRSKSCLHLIAKAGYKNLVFHNAVRLLIRRKWKEFARFRFQLNSFLFFVTQAGLCFCAVVAAMATDPRQYGGALHVVRAVMEVWVSVVVLCTFLLELNQMRKHRLDYFMDQFNWIDITSSGLLLSVVALRWAHREEQWPVYSAGFLLWTLRIFKYATVFRQTGAYSQILWRIVAHDFPQFIVVFSVILMAFSGSFLLALRGEDSLDVHDETRTFWHILFTGVRILIEGEPVVEYTGPSGYKTLSCILMVVFLFTCCVVLLNILIAQLSDTYQNVQRDAQRGLELNRAWIIARVELNSLHWRKNIRQMQYLEAEEMNNPKEVLEKWENPPLNEMNKHVQDIWDSLDSHKLNLLTIKNRLFHQEKALNKIQNQMDKVLDLMTQMPLVSSSNLPIRKPPSDVTDTSLAEGDNGFDQIVDSHTPHFH